MKQLRLKLDIAVYIQSHCNILKEVGLSLRGYIDDEVTVPNMFILNVVRDAINSEMEDRIKKR